MHFYIQMNIKVQRYQMYFAIYVDILYFNINFN